MTRVSEWKDRRKRIDWPLFPGYCFARFSTIPDKEITAIQQVISSRQPYEAHRQLVEGMVVQVIRGPLIGLQGKLLKKTDECRLIITIDLIGQGVAVHINANDITPPAPSSVHP